MLKRSEFYTKVLEAISALSQTNLKGNQLREILKPLTEMMETLKETPLTLSFLRKGGKTIDVHLYYELEMLAKGRFNPYGTGNLPLFFRSEHQGEAIYFKEKDHPCYRDLTALDESDLTKAQWEWLASFLRNYRNLDLDPMRSIFGSSFGVHPMQVTCLLRKEQQMKVYVAFGKLSKMVKIGVSHQPKVRVKNFSEPVTLIAELDIGYKSAFEVEQRALQIMSSKFERFGECFNKATPEDAITAVRSALAQTPDQPHLRKAYQKIVIQKRIYKRATNQDDLAINTVNAKDIHHIVTTDGHSLPLIWDSNCGTWAVLVDGLSKPILGVSVMMVYQNLERDIYPLHFENKQWVVFAVDLSYVFDEFEQTAHPELLNFARNYDKDLLAV